MCNNNDIDVSPRWYGWYVELEMDSEGANESGDLFEKYGGTDPEAFTKDPWSLAGIITAGRFGTIPGVATWAIGWLIGKWGKDLKDNDNGCGVRVKMRLVGDNENIYIPFYTVESQ